MDKVDLDDSKAPKWNFRSAADPGREESALSWKSEATDFYFLQGWRLERLSAEKGVSQFGGSSPDIQGMFLLCRYLRWVYV